jgi:hypothetical protein
MPAQNLDQSRLLDTAVSEGKAAFQAALAKYPNERFYAFCFYTDNDVSSVYPTASTTEGSQRICNSDDPDDLNYYRWAPAEWDIDFGQFGDADLMLETNKLLHPDYSNYGDEPAVQFGERKRQTLITLTNALLKTRESGIFANRAVRDRIAFWINIGDAMPEEIEWMFQPAIPHLETDDVTELRRLFQFS